MGTAVTTKDQRAQLRAELDRYDAKLASFGVEPEAYKTAALMAAVKTPELFNCTPESVALALTQAAQTGLVVGLTAHLVPFGRTCTFIPDYRGYIELALGTHKVLAIRTRCVYANEEFSYTEGMSGPIIEHKPITKGDPGPIIGAYAIADLQFGRAKAEYMRVEEIDEIRRSKSKSWKSGPLQDWYGRKTVVRRLCKTLPMSKKLQMALKYDDTEEIPDGEYSLEDQRQIREANQPPRALAGGDPYGYEVEPTQEQVEQNGRRALAASTHDADD